MEIFQTIWTALTTENVLIANIINIPLGVIEISLIMLLFTSIINIPTTKRQKFLYVAIASILASICNFIMPAPYNTYINLFLFLLLVFFIFKVGFLKSILCLILPYVILLLTTPILLSIFTKLLNITSYQLTYIPIYKLIYGISLYSVVFMIYLLSLQFNLNISLINSFRKNINIRLLIIFFIGTIAICIQGYLVNVYSNYIPLTITLISISASIVYFLISMYSLIRTNQLESTTQSLEEERLYNKTLTILYDNIRGFKHDFNNIVQAIGGYISTDNINGLKDYYSDLLEDCQKVNNLAILNPELINNPAVYSLLTSKYHRAEEVGIKMNFEIFLDLKSLNIKTYDLTRILGILLDNAIEASSKCNEKEIYITIRKDNKANRQLFIIENTYSNKDVNTDRIFEKGYTSKTDEDNKNHGLGLWEVRKILKKNNNLNLFTTKNNKLFKQQLEIYL